MAKFSSPCAKTWETSDDVTDTVAQAIITEDKHRRKRVDDMSRPWEREARMSADIVERRVRNDQRKRQCAFQFRTGIFGPRRGAVIPACMISC